MTTVPKTFEFNSLHEANQAFPNNVWKEVENSKKTIYAENNTASFLLIKKYKEIQKKDPEYSSYAARLILGIFLTTITLGLAYHFSKFVPSLFKNRRYVLIKIRMDPKHYSRKKVEERFFAKTEKAGKKYLFGTLIRGALKVTVLISESDLFNTCRKAIQKELATKLERKPRADEINAKIMSLVLRVQYALVNLEELIATLPPSDPNRPNKIPPHIRVFGKNTKAVSCLHEKGREFFIQYPKTRVGGLNLVFKIFSLKEAKFYAYRVLKDGYLNNPYNIGEWKKEVQVYKQLMKKKIPNLVKLEKTIIVKDGEKIIQAGLFLELCRKEDLSRIENIETERRLKYIGDILKTLKAFHEKNLVHQDLKTENILLKDEQEICLADFGFTRNISEGPILDRSVFNMPPDVYKTDIYPNKQVLGIDCFAAGILIYDLKYRLSDEYLNLCSFLTIFRDSRIRYKEDFIEKFKNQIRDRRRFLEEFSQICLSLNKKDPKEQYEHLEKKFFIPKIETLIQEMITHARKNLNDPENVLICNLLNLNFKKRWSTTTAVHYLENTKAPQPMKNLDHNAVMKFSNVIS